MNSIKSTYQIDVIARDLSCVRLVVTALDLHVDIVRHIADYDRLQKEW